MADMRTLAYLFSHFQQQENEQDSSTEDMDVMFRRENWSELVEAVKLMTIRGGKY